MSVNEIIGIRMDLTWKAAEVLFCCCFFFFLFLVSHAVLGLTVTIGGSRKIQIEGTANIKCTVHAAHTKSMHDVSLFVTCITMLPGSRARLRALEALGFDMISRAIGSSLILKLTDHP